MSDEFYLRDSRSNTGSNLMFWAVGGGYTSDLSRAEVFTKSAAESQHNCRNSDVPMRKDLIDTCAREVVDMQLLRKDVEMPEIGDSFYVQVTGMYDGNDVFWVSRNGGASTRLSEAVIYDGQLLLESMIRNGSLRGWPTDFIESKARKSVSIEDIDISRILRAGGIKINKPKPVPKYVTRCGHCGIFLSERQQYEDCQKCGGDNRP